MCAALKKKMKEMKQCVFIVPSLTFFIVALQCSGGEIEQIKKILASKMKQK